MIVTYLRSSSISSYTWCAHKFFISSNLGIKEPSGQKAELGNIVHKALELLARKKLAIQNNEEKFSDEELGLSFDTQPFSVEESIQFGWDHYTDPSRTIHSWNQSHKKQAIKWTFDVINFNDGMFNPLKRNIIMPEQYFDMEIDCDWAKYEYYVPGTDKKEKFNGRLRIKGTMDLVTRADKGLVEYIDWKGLPVETPIPTVDGWSTMGDLKVGDAIFDKDGNITKVLAKSLESYKPCYRITFDDKTEVICDNEHLWLIDTGEVKPITELKVKDKIDIAKPFVSKERDLPIDPYVLGTWLGDGRKRSGEICADEDFTFDEIERRGYDLGKNLEKREGMIKNRTVIGLRTELRKLDLLNNKHIPIQYLRASYAQRLDLLRGLMDTDGSVNTKRKQCIFTSCNKKLSDNVKELLLSLGQRVNQANIIRDTNFKDNVSIFPLSFRPININPFLMPRKKEKVGNWGYGKSNKRQIKNIELLNTHMKTQCIMVDSPSNTYLCTENMIPTHNTGQRKDWSTGKEKGYEDLRKDFQMRLYHYALCKLYPDDDILMTIFFAQAGGPFSLFLDRTHLKETEDIIKTYYQAIQRNNFPKRILDFNSNSWKCSRLCSYFKENWEGTEQNKCSFIRDQITQIGLDKVVAKFKISESPWGSYGSGGGVTNRDGETK